MPEICLRYTQDMPEICPRFARDMPKKCPRYAQHMPKKRPRYVRDMPEICPRYAREICKKNGGRMSAIFTKVGPKCPGAKCPWGKMSPSRHALVCLKKLWFAVTMRANVRLLEINSWLQCVWKRWDHQVGSSSATRVMCSASSVGRSFCQVLCRNKIQKMYKIWNLEFIWICKHCPELWTDPTHRWTVALFVVDPWQADQLH